MFKKESNECYYSSVYFYLHEIKATNTKNIIAVKGNNLIPKKKEQLLNFSDSVIIPENQVHSLTVITKMKATVVMPLDSTLKFIK